jgi:hypothetical protein
VIKFDAHVAETPAGKPFAPDTPAFDIPVAPMVVIVIFVSTVLIHNVGVEEGVPAVLFGVTVICTFPVVPAQLALPQLGLPPGVTQHA